MSIEVANESGTVVDEAALVRVARHALDRLGVAPLAELSLLLVDAEQMEQLHLRWMDEPGPTDVLSFPMDELDLRGSRGVSHARGSAADEPADAEPVVLGDIVLCPEIAEQQGAAAGHGTKAELALLTTHGVLHLLGFDHAEPDEKAQMFGLQAELLAGLQVSTDAPEPPQDETSRS